MSNDPKVKHYPDPFVLASSALATFGLSVVIFAIVGIYKEVHLGWIISTMVPFVVTAYLVWRKIWHRYKQLPKTDVKNEIKVSDSAKTADIILRITGSVVLTAVYVVLLVFVEYGPDVGQNLGGRAPYTLAHAFAMLCMLLVYLNWTDPITVKSKEVKDVQAGPTTQASK